MAERKFIKAVCRTKNRYFGMDADRFGSTYEITNFVDITPEEAAILTTQVHQERFKVHDNLQACYDDNSRFVGSSSAPYGKRECVRGGYNYNCLFCNRLEIDYSGATLTGQYRKGDVIRLSQGQEVRIEFEEDTPVDEVLIGAGWDQARQGKMDVDCSVILAGQGCGELVYFGRRASENRSVIHYGDNLTGIDSDTESKDDENIAVYLNKIDAKYQRLVFVFNIYSRQDLNELRNMFFRVVNPKTNKTVIEYPMEQTYRSGDNAVIVAEARRSRKGWILKAINRSLKVESIHDLDSRIRYGEL